MRILLVIDSFGSGGAQRQMVNLALGLHGRGHQPEFYIYYPQYAHFLGVVEQAGIPVHAVQKSSRFSANVLLQLWRVVVSGKYDAMVSFLDTPNFYAEMSRWALDRPALVVSERFMYPLNRLPAHLRLMQQFHRLADWITVNSHHQRERMEREFPWMRGKISTIYNGVDLGQFRPQWSSGRGNSTSLHLLAVGGENEKKNAVGLVHGLATYRARYGEVPSVDWAGKRAHPEYASQVDELLDRLELRPYWRWLGERSDIPDLLREHDALIHPAFREGLPNAVCEALACGRPVLASNVCDHPRLVQHGVTGYLFDPGSPDTMVDAIRSLAVMTPADRVEMGKAARLFAERELSLDTYVSRYEALLLRLSREHSDRGKKGV